MTAHALIEERQRCLDAGMNDHVSKPIDPDNLFSTLLRWVKPRTSKAIDAQPPQPPAKVPDEIVLPEIAGVNQADGLKRVAGNRRLYRDLLGQFAAKQGDAAAQISAALDSGDRQLAERIAHTVKGVAGNIGITEVQSAAQKLEKAIRERESDVTDLLEDFAILMTAQAQAIAQALRDTQPASAEVKHAAPFDPEAAVAAIARLKSLLEASDGDAGEAFGHLPDAVGGVVEKQKLEALGASISNFDFEAALLRLDEIAERCKQTEDQAI
jgi:HPt (histidine-containing phosphotransfer) domain-containing protein